MSDFQETSRPVTPIHEMQEESLDERLTRVESERYIAYEAATRTNQIDERPSTPISEMTPVGDDEKYEWVEKIRYENYLDATKPIAIPAK